MAEEKLNIQKFWNIDIGNLIRNEDLNGRHYVVVPMTMILEGVHTGSQGPVYYSVEELAKTPKMWNMKPIVIEHPFRGDTATDLEVYKRQAVGMIMNTHFIDGKLKAEAWIDKELVQEKCPEVLQHIEYRLPMEISTGLFSELVTDEGVWNGEPYKGRIINIRADHLAILPHKQGACSLSDGAGLLINQKKTEKETLNVITTIVNDYISGSSVDESPTDLIVDFNGPSDKKIQPGSEDFYRNTNTDDDGLSVPEEKKIDTLANVQKFKTAEGYTIIIVPPENPILTDNKNLPVFESTGEETLNPDRVPPKEPIHDNPVVVDSTIKHKGDADSVFIESLHRAVNAARRLRNDGVQLTKETLPSLQGTVDKLQEQASVLQLMIDKGTTLTDAEIERVVNASKLLDTIGALVQEINGVAENTDMAVGVYNSTLDASYLVALDAVVQQYPELLKISECLQTLYEPII